MTAERMSKVQRPYFFSIFSILRAMCCFTDLRAAPGCRLWIVLLTIRAVAYIITEESMGKGASLVPFLFPGQCREDQSGCWSRR